MAVLLGATRGKQINDPYDKPDYETDKKISKIMEKINKNNKKNMALIMSAFGVYNPGPRNTQEILKMQEDIDQVDYWTMRYITNFKRRF
jgi:NAD-dependent DNA ligase